MICGPAPASDARDMDAMMFYDHFTPFCLINLETYGFVPPR